MGYTMTYYLGKEHQMECWDYIASHNLDYFLGNAVKYITRAGKKDPNTYDDDLFKAMDYIGKARELRKLEVLNECQQRG